MPSYILSLEAASARGVCCEELVYLNVTLKFLFYFSVSALTLFLGWYGKGMSSKVLDSGF